MMHVEFLPHGHCFLWEPRILWTFAVSDAVIFLSYVSISLRLVLLHRKRPDIIPLNVIFLSFAAFIFTCGVGHILDVANIWHGRYALSASWRLMTAICSAPVGFFVWRWHSSLDAVPSPEDFRQANIMLAEHIRELEATSLDDRRLRQLKQDLDERLVRLREMARLYRVEEPNG